MSRELWDRYRRQLCVVDSVGLLLDPSRADLDDATIDSYAPGFIGALADMAALEAGAIANPDEKRMVGHYWLRDPGRAPTPEIRDAISGTLARIQAFTGDVHGGRIAATGGPFTHLLVVGIGGSALGPELVADALGTQHDRLAVSFFDNTDPDGFDRVLARLPLATTLTVVISKSGGTKETRNGMLEAAAAYKRAGLEFPRHAVAVTGAGSELDRTAESQGWLARFPMWDWVGGRTSELSAVGLLPAALQGIDIDALLAGARLMDEATRLPDIRKNPAALLAIVWHHETDGRGRKDMVILPYRDRLALTSRYLQQLVMESLGKERDLAGNLVHQGIAVYGNKGSTDQHAYVQQLRDGVPNFFVTFIEALHDRDVPSLEVDPGATSGDYLLGFLLGTRQALYEKGRHSVTITIPRVDARALGALIALFERAVGLYASLVGINAYHQPGVEAGKRAAGEVLALQARVLAALDGTPQTVEDLAQRLGASDDAEIIYKILEHAAANCDHGVDKLRGDGPFRHTYRIKT